jgi:hypothetical protein
MAWANFRWWLAQVPVLFLALILAKPEVNFFKSSRSL